MHPSISISALFFVTATSFCLVGGSIIRQKQNEGAPAKRIQNLDDDGKVLMSWAVEADTITFEVEAETTGWIGFGVSPQGGMAGADIFIAGVNPDGTVYSSDRHALTQSMPVADDHSDWDLLDAQEFEGISRKITYLKMSRKLNTCDDQDYPISNDTNRLIYAIGETDEIEYHKEWRGTRSIHLLGAEMPQLETEDIPVWNFVVDMTMPSLDTAYWCTFHRGPALTKKHHVVGFEAFLPDADALRHTHHFVIYNCFVNSSELAEEIFGNFTFDKYQGDLCFDDFTGDVIPPVQYCKEFLFVWAKGGLQMALPENVGYPIGPDSDTDVELLQQFYMLEIHYDNPNKLDTVKFQTGVQMYYQEELRPIEAGMMVIQHDTMPSLTLPPNVEDFMITGHCAPECTEHFPSDGITIFNSMLHSHLSGRNIKLRQFRDGKELSWVDYDDHYDFNYQQNKQLLSPRKVLPGDQLTIECKYSTMWKEGKVVIGDLSTQDEMCQVFTWYYPKMDIAICGSAYPLDKGVREDFGITKYEMVPSTVGGQDVLMIQEPLNLAGEYEETLNLRFHNWTQEFKQEFQRKRRWEDHTASCLNMLTSEQLTDGVFVKYPEDFEPYVPDDYCATGKPDLPDPENPGNGNSGNNLGLRASFLSICFVLSKLF